MAKKGTYIKLDRGISDNWVWEQKPFSLGQAWVDLLLMAAWKTSPRNWKGSFITQHRGEVFTSMTALADRWGWNRKKVARFIEALERDKMVTHNVLPHGTLITIENYTRFQGRGTAERAEDGTAEGQQRDTIEERRRREKKTRAREGSEGEPSAALEEVEAEGMPDWFKEQVEGMFGKM